MPPWDDFFTNRESHHPLSHFFLDTGFLTRTSSFDSDDCVVLVPCFAMKSHLIDCTMYIMYVHGTRLRYYTYRQTVGAADGLEGAPQRKTGGLGSCVLFTNMDTQNDGLEKVTPFKNGNFGIHVSFQGSILNYIWVNL